MFVKQIMNILCYYYYSQTRPSVPVANGLINSLMENCFHSLVPQFFHEMNNAIFKSSLDNRMFIGLINKNLAIYGVLGKACPKHGGVLSVVECDRAGRLFYSSTRHQYKMLFTFSTGVVPHDSSDSYLQFRFDNSCEYLRKCTT